MFRLTFNDTIASSGERGSCVLAVDLQHVLRALGADALRWTWSVGEVDMAGGEPLWATGEGSSGLARLDESGERVSGSRLLEIAERIHQVIWGEFRAYRYEGKAEPWIRIIAFDGRYEVWCEDRATLERVASFFTDTTLTLASPTDQ